MEVIRYADCERKNDVKALIRRFDQETFCIFEYDETHFFNEIFELLLGGLAEFLVCQKDGRPIGVLVFLTAPGVLNKTKTCTEMIWYVLPEFRNTVCAGLLYRTMLNISKERGCKKLVMGLHNGNRELHDCYTRHGMVEMETQFKMKI